MGLFSSKKTYVSSVSFNMAGNEEDRPNFLKTAVITHNLVGNRKYISETLTESYLYGPGMKLRSFYRWCENNYDLIGVPQSTIRSNPEIDNDVLIANIPYDIGDTVNIQDARISTADTSFWAEQYMFSVHPDLMNTDWISDYDEITNQVKITFEDTTTVSFIPDDWDKNGTYLYVTYDISYVPGMGPLIEGNNITLGKDEDYPDTTGWSEESSSTIPTDVVLNKLVTVTEEFSNGDPTVENEYSSTTDESYDVYEAVYTRTTYKGNAYPDMDANYEKLESIYLYQIGSINIETTTEITYEDMGGGVTKTITTVTEEEILQVTRYYRIDYTLNYLKAWTDTQIFIYKMNSGNADLDALSYSAEEYGGFFPFIPLRLDNKFLSESYLPDAYSLAGKAYKKAMGSKNKITKIIDNISENENLEDINYAYIVFGVSLNVKENACRKYIYRFFDKIRQNSNINPVGSSDWPSYADSYISSRNNYNKWRLNQYILDDIGFGDPEPPVQEFRSIPVNEIRIKTDSSIPTNYDIAIGWSEIKRTTGIGLAKPDAKKGEYWFTSQGPDTYDTTFKLGDELVVGTTGVRSLCRLFHQIDETEWECLELYDLIHTNYIYKGKFVKILGVESLTDPDESGFIIPIHYETFREMSLVDSTQMSNACVFMTLNCYKVVKTGFFGSFFFKILLVVAIIAITAFVPPAGAVVGGVLGTSAAVGAALGFTGLAATLIGTIANALVSMIIMKALTMFSTAVFGEKFGQIITAVLSIVAMTASGNFTQGFNFNFSNLTNITTIMQLTMAVGNAYAGMIVGNAADTMVKTQELLSDYKDKSKEIDSLYEQNIGYGMGVFNPLLLTDAANVYMESPETFLARTLMTGSDLIEYQMTLLTDFADLSLNTRLII